MRKSIRINKAPLIYQLSEIKADGKYWFLYFIGEFSYNCGVNFSDFYFINKNSLDDNFEIGKFGVKVVITMESSLLATYEVGYIFSQNGYFQANIFDYKPRKDYVNISLPGNYLSTDEEIDFNINSCNYPLPEKKELNGFSYYKKYIYNNGNKVFVIIPESILSAYLYFRTTFITNSLLSRTFLDLVDLSNIKFFTIKGKKVAKLPYDNRKVLPQEIQSIIQFLFIKESRGSKSLNCIGSDLFIKYSRKDQLNYKNSFLQVPLPFPTDIDLQLIGKYFSDGSENYFLAFHIKKMKLLDEKIFDFNDLILSPMYPYEFNEDKLIYKRGVEKINFNPVTKESISFNSSGTTRLSLYLGFNTYIKSYLKKKDGTSEFEYLYDYYESVNDVQKMMRQERSVFMQKFSDYFYKDPKYGMSVICFNNYLTEYFDTNITVFGEEYKIMIIELNYDNNFFYSIEISKDFTIFMSTELNFSKIDEIHLNLVSERIIADFWIDYNKCLIMKEEDYLRYKQDFGITIYPHESKRSSFRFDLDTIAEEYAKYVKSEILKYLTKAA